MFTIIVCIAIKLAEALAERRIIAIMITIMITTTLVTVLLLMLLIAVMTMTLMGSIRRHSRSGGAQASAPSCRSSKRPANSNHTKNNGHTKITFVLVIRMLLRPIVTNKSSKRPA